METSAAGRRGAAGFSLLEVLVATALMGMILVVLLQVLTAALRAQEASRNHSRAVLVAENAIKEYGEVRNLSRGVFQGREGRFAYLVRLEPQYQVILAASRKQVVCSLVQVTVSWEERGKPKSLELQTMRTAVQKRS